MSMKNDTKYWKKNVEGWLPDAGCRMPDTRGLLPYPRRAFLFSFFIICLVGLMEACATTKDISSVNEKNFHSSPVSADSLAAQVPDYRNQLSTVKGKAKAIVSGPKKSNRVTLYFSGSRQQSLITVKNSIGIEGAKILASGDSLLIYNKIKKYARKISASQGSLNDVNHLASVNLLKLLNYPVDGKNIHRVMESDKLYLLLQKSGGKIYIGKNNGLIHRVVEPRSAKLPYSKIIYSGYERIGGLTLPRRITIFSANRSTKIDLLVQSLKINPTLKKLSIDLPKGTKIYHQ